MTPVGAALSRKNGQTGTPFFFRIDTLLLGSLLFLLPLMGFAQDDGPNGKKLFENNCQTCHTPTEEEKAAPGLAGVRSRWEGNEELLYQWVQEPRKVADMGNDYVDEMVAKWKPKYGMMNAQAVSKEEIDAILNYVENYEPPKKEVAAKEGKEGKPAAKETEGNNTLLWIIIGALLLVVVLSLNSVRSSLQEAVRDREGRSPPVYEPVSTRIGDWMNRHKALTGFIGLIVVIVLLKAGWDALMQVGVYQGYQPKQPIEFPHDIHAGKNDIACVYCHVGADEGRHATIPSAGLCMNCHEQIAKGPNTGKEEIKKLYAATGFDPKTRTYSGETKPVKWVKVHNLPDFAYFNHSQHVEVAELECQECHGKIEEMGVAQQNAKLTMGWCLDCHQNTEVDLADNGYYQEVKKRMPDELMKKHLKDEKITVRELGGWECVKCHY